jgi:glycine dehydrogenase subunit 1
MASVRPSPYVPHTEAEVRAMLERIGAHSIDALFEAVPAGQRFPALDLPQPLSEMEVLADLRALAARNQDAQHLACFLGAGAYNHYIPSVVGHITGRAEFYTAYTPYQPEVSQGTLQSIFEYQTMICALTGMDVSNASHYDGATAAAEAVIMAVSSGRGKQRRVVLSPGLHPEYRQTIRTYTQGMDLTIVGDDDLANRDPRALAALVDDRTACLIVQNPDFCGRIWDLEGLAEQVHAHGALLVVACNPISLGLLRAPGDCGADVALGEGQPLGIPLAFGGPYLGFFACKQEHVRRMAGRLVGQTVDDKGRTGYVLTLSTREQHIRRERATSNICTNQGLNALAACVYLAALGKRGLRQVAELCYHKAHYAARRIGALPGYRVLADGPFFHEFIVRCPRPVAEINSHLLDRGILGGLDLGTVHPGQQSEMLICVTEMNSADQIDALVTALGEVSA